MTCFISIRACPNPNDFFDEFLSDEGQTFQGWRLSIRKISSPTMSDKTPDTFVDVRWLHAEFDCEPEQVKETLQAQLPELQQFIRVLAGVRSNHFNQGLRFSMYFEEYIHDGVLHMIHPFKVDAGIGVLNVQFLDGNGTVLSDAKAFEARQAEARRQAAKRELRVLAANIIPLLDDPQFRRAWESYSLAQGSDNYAIGHLYDIREAAEKRFGNAQKVLKLCENEWGRFGKLFNGAPVMGGRHNGVHSAPLRSLTPNEKTQAMIFAKKMLDAFAKELESRAALS